MHPNLRLVLLAALTLVAALLRGVAMGEPLWLDELHTSWTVAAGWTDVVPRAAEANQSPLYFLALYPLVGLTGPQEWALRLPSLLAATMLVPLLFVTVWRMTGDEAAGWLAALLLTVDRDCLFYGHEARPYACVQLAALLHVLIFYGLLREANRWRRAQFVGGGLLLFYLHYTASLLLLAELAALLLLHLGPAIHSHARFRSNARLHSDPCPRPNYRPRQMLADLLLIGLLCLPAAGQLVWIAGRRQQWSPYVPAPGVLGILGLFRWEVTIGLPLVVLGLAAACQQWGKTRMLNPPKAFSTVVILAWSLVPPALAFAATWLGIAPLALLRYVIVSAIAPLAFAGNCLAILRPRWLRMLLALVLLVLVPLRGGLPQQFAQDGRLVGDRREDWRTAVARINDASDASELVLLCSGSLEDAALRGPDADPWRAFCRFPVEGIYALRDDLRVQPLPTRGSNRLDAARLRELIEAGGGWWLVRGDHRLADVVVQDARNQLADHAIGLRVVEQLPLGNLTLVRLELVDQEQSPR